MQLGLLLSPPTTTPDGGGIQRGNVGEWVSGLGAFAAAAVAVIVPLRIWRHERIERERDDIERAAEHERRRSTMVTAWLDVAHDQAVVRNSGPEVIYYWSVVVCRAERCFNHPSHEHQWQMVMQCGVNGALTPGVPMSAPCVVPEEAMIVARFDDPTGQQWERCRGHTRPIVVERHEHLGPY